MCRNGCQGLLSGGTQVGIQSRSTTRHCTPSDIHGNSPGGSGPSAISPCPSQSSTSSPEFSPRSDSVWARGPLVVVLGWIGVSGMVLFIGAAMGEVASACPTSGAPYFSAGKPHFVNNTGFTSGLCGGMLGLLGTCWTFTAIVGVNVVGLSLPTPCRSSRGSGSVPSSGPDPGSGAGGALPSVSSPSPGSCSAVRSSCCPRRRRSPSAPSTTHRSPWPSYWSWPRSGGSPPRGAASGCR